MNEPTKKTDHMDALMASDAPMGSVNELRKFLDETDPSVDLLKRAEDAVFWLRNGGEDDPYLTTTPELMGFQREQARANGDDLPGDITICVADECLVCTVATNEGEPMFGMAEAIAGAGKLINELSIEVTSLRARVAELEKELEHTRECRLEDERAWRGIREERDAACDKLARQTLNVLEYNKAMSRVAELEAQSQEAQRPMKCYSVDLTTHSIVEEAVPQHGLLDSELTEYAQLTDKLGDILARTANALKGPPSELSSHDWSDLPKVGTETVADRNEWRDQHQNLLAIYHGEQHVCAKIRADNAKLRGLLEEAADKLCPAGIAPVGSAWTSIGTADYDSMHVLADRINAALTATACPKGNT